METNHRSASRPGAVWHTRAIARLILINGPPGIGKSTLAHRYAADHPLALVVDIDSLRTSMGRWETNEESKILARVLAVAMARTHLAGGHDVVIPQLLARPEFIETLAALAGQTGAAFHEIILLAPTADAYTRLDQRRAELDAANLPHPLRLVAIDPASLEVTIDQLRSIVAVRTSTRVIETASGDVDGAYKAVTRAIGAAAE